MTNGNTLAQKEKAWQKIRAEVKEKIGGQWEKICPKSSWTHMKLQARKYKAATRSELYKTGGGKSVAPVYDPFLEKITSLIGKSAMGVTLKHQNDSDTLPSTSTSNVGKLLMESAIEEERIDDPDDVFATLIENSEIASWGSAEGTGLLKKKISEPLRQIRENATFANNRKTPQSELYNKYLEKKIEKEENKIKLLKIQMVQAQLQIKEAEEKLKRLNRERL
ncbi:uncharacterized protein [Prorops nasuta]|uniref:uncharacterized protein n=1 Tax=Prorops nasuta TaxID=863751 RepID=UPI0034CD7C6D